ncbi:alpha/beta fold hydrolase [Silvimonas amylolytica]|uniref:Alpha/beta hydrolase n=1 Tax=Silvimonas amylolytica TaxID=449663 RepID=A0ABQ2PJX2_9NEIS|nr:alpha/beta hydrolase [Silvimonas amylolytica]GGP25289.1 alpha/beta hydrolase [Silvimonas amylolytica]
MKTIALLALMVGLSACTSTSTHPITDQQGAVIPGSIASLEAIQLGGVRQWILIRGKSMTNPILLKLHGGPGQAEMATVAFNRQLEDEFVVVEWDQRGAGKSADAINPERAMTTDQFVQDTHELTRLLLQRFHQRQLILVGHSWGSIIGLLAVQKYPQDYQAFVSTGQIVSFSQGMAVSYAFLLDEAKRRGNTEALDQLSQIGPPPYQGPDSKSRRDVYEKWLGHFGALWHGNTGFDRVGWMISSVEYAWPEKLAFERAAERSFDLLLPQLATTDLATTVPKVDVPVYFAVGRYDHLAPYEISQAYFTHLQAPAKTWVWFENSAHFPQWEEPQKFHDLLTQKVLPETEGLRVRSTDK